MARLNIEDDLYKRGEWMHLILDLKCPDTAIGALVRVWTVAQRYWADGKKLIPIEVWKREKLNDAVLNCGFAEIKKDGIYAIGSEECFAWILEKKECGKLGGIASGEARRSNIEAKRSKVKQSEASASKRTNSEAANPPTPTPTPTLKGLREEESPLIPSDILNTIKVTMQYPDAVIEEVRKDAWIKYNASDRPDKNWRRFIGNYFANEKDKIREMAISKNGSVEKKKPESVTANEIALKIFNAIISGGHHGVKDTLMVFSPVEKKTMEIFGGSSQILNCTDFDSPQVKARLKSAVIEAMKNECVSNAS